jgi:hypothetical protein
VFEFINHLAREFHMQVFSSIRRGLALALIVSGLAAAQVQAQSSFISQDADWWNRLEAQLTAGVQSDVPQVREDATRQIIFFAENFSDQTNFDEAANEIMGQFEMTDHVGERLLALAALNAIGESRTIDRLARIAEAEASPRVRTVTAAVLKAHAASL